MVNVIKFRRLRWAAYTQIGRGRSALTIAIGKSIGNKPLERPKRRWEGNIRIYIKKIGVTMRDWIDPVYYRGYWRGLVNAAFNLRTT
jgi:hypothetical protein